MGLLLEMLLDHSSTPVNSLSTCTRVGSDRLLDYNLQGTRNGNKDEQTMSLRMGSDPLWMVRFSPPMADSSNGNMEYIHAAWRRQPAFRNVGSLVV